MARSEAEASVQMAQQRSELQVGTYARLHGHLRQFDGRRRIQAFNVKPIMDFNEVRHPCVVEQSFHGHPLQQLSEQTTGQVGASKPSWYAGHVPLHAVHLPACIPHQGGFGFCKQPGERPAAASTASDRAQAATRHIIQVLLQAHNAEGAACACIQSSCPAQAAPKAEPAATNGGGSAYMGQNNLTGVQAEVLQAFKSPQFNSKETGVSIDDVSPTVCVPDLCPQCYGWSSQVDFHWTLQLANPA